MRKDNTGVETFIAEDLLVSLGAIRMALSWVESDTSNGGNQTRTVGIQRLDDELAALQLRSREVSRALRYEMRSQGTFSRSEAISSDEAEDEIIRPIAREDGTSDATRGRPTDLDETLAEKTIITPAHVIDEGKAPETPEISTKSSAQSEVPPPRQVHVKTGELSHSIDELLMSAMNDPKNGQPRSAQV